MGTTKLGMIDLNVFKEVLYMCFKVFQKIKVKFKCAVFQTKSGTDNCKLILCYVLIFAEILKILVIGNINHQ